MKKVLMIFLNLFTCIVVRAQSIPIQLLVADANGFEKINTQVKLRLTLRNDTASSSGQYTEVHTTITNEFGIVSVNFGEGIPTSNSQVMGLEGFNFSVNGPFINTELDTSISPSNYYSLGWMKYSYPIVARRALQADTAEFARNFNESYNDFNLKCVEMGVGPLCPSLGIDSTVCQLSPDDNYTHRISFQNDLNSSNQSIQINWRKFEVEGLMLDSSKHLLLRYSEYRETNSYYETYHRLFNAFITPEIINDRVYFYLYKTNSNTCLTSASLASVIPLGNSFRVGFYQNSVWDYYRPVDFELYYEHDGAYKDTGIRFSVTH